MFFFNLNSKHFLPLSCLLLFIINYCLLFQLVESGGIGFDLNELPAADEEAEDELSVPDEIRREDNNNDDLAKQAAAAAASGGGHLKSKGRIRFSNMFEKLKSDTLKGLKKLPNYFDFEWFKKKFNKTYSSGELLYRKSVFFKRCMEVFKSRILDRLGKTTYIKDVNKFSDKSPNEIKRMFMSGPPIELKPKNQSIEDYRREIEKNFNDRETWDAELESRGSLNELDGNAGADADGRILINELQVNKEIELMLLAQDDDDDDGEFQLALMDELEGKEIETDSNAALNDLPSSTKLPWPGQLKSRSQSQSQLKDNDDTGTGTDTEYRPPKLSSIERDYLNWSEHPCFHTIYDQKDKCGKCYVMAATALAEFYKCSEKIDIVDKRKFSKEYVLDCAQKFSPATIYGCKGGSMLDTARFISIAGIFNIRGWKTKLEKELKNLRELQGGFISEYDLQCPLNEFSQLDDDNNNNNGKSFVNWGDIHIDMNPIKINVNQWFQALQDGPLIASVQMPNGVETYKQGVHDGFGCENSKNWHTMILVGYGIDPKTGISYWRFRNSFGPDWGENGHFNLAMSVSSKCLIGGVRIYREPIQD